LRAFCLVVYYQLNLGSAAKPEGRKIIAHGVSRGERAASLM